LQVNWEVYDEKKIGEDRMRPWVAKKVTAFLAKLMSVTPLQTCRGKSVHVELARSALDRVGRVV
jgi:hypothetical protein